MKFITYNGEAIALFLLRPDWSQEIKLEIDLTGNVLVTPSLSKRESRSRFGKTGRYALEYDVFTNDFRQSTQLRLFLQRLKGEMVAVPLWTDAVQISGAVSIGNTSLGKTSINPVQYGAEWIILNPATAVYEIVTVSAITGSTITLASPGAALAWPDGTFMFPLMFGNVLGRPKFSAETDEILSGKIKFQENSTFARRLNPYAGTIPVVGANIAAFSTKPLWNISPQYVNVMDESEVDIIYRQIGFLRQDQQDVKAQAVRRGLEMDFYQTSRDNIAAVTRMFVDRYGPGKTLMFPTFRGDLKLANDVSAGGAADPTTVAGMKLWLKADSLSLSDGNPVGTWADQSGNAKDATQATAGFKPLFKTNIINGLPVVRFDGIDDTMATASLALSQPTTIFVVGKQTSKATIGTFFDSSIRQILRFETTGFLLINAGSTLTDAVDHSGAFRIIGAVFNGASSFGYIDGTQKTTGNAGANTLGTAILGFQNSPGQYLNGDIAEVLVYNSALSTADRQTVESYLGAKYGITVPGGGGSSSITVQTSDFTDTARPLNPGDPYICLIETSGGVASFDPQKIATPITSTTLALLGSVSAHLALRTKVSHLLLGRIAQTTLTWTYHTDGKATARVKFIETPDEYASPQTDLIEEAVLFVFTEQMPTPLVSRFTSYETSLTLAGTTWDGAYTPAPFERSDTTEGLRLDEEKIEITSFDFSLTTNPLRKVIDNALEGVLHLDVLVADANNLSAEPTVFFSGDLAGLEPKGKDWKATFRFLGQFLSRQYPRFYFQKICQVPLYHPKCSMLKANFLTDGTLYAFATDGSYIDIAQIGGHPDPGVKATDFFAIGSFETGTGANFERRNVMHSQTFSGKLRLYFSKPLRKAVINQVVNIYPGCDGSLTTCINTYNNAANFRGHPFIPDKNPSANIGDVAATTGGKK